MTAKPWKSQGLFLTAAVLSSLFLSFLAFSLGIHIEQSVLGNNGVVSLGRVGWIWIVLVVSILSVTGAYGVGRRRLFEIAYSLLMAVALINLCMLALPFFGVPYVTSSLTVIAVAVGQLFLLYGWAYAFHRLFFIVFPRRTAVIVADTVHNAAYCADQIRSCSREFVVAACMHWEQYGSDPPAHAVVIAFGLDSIRLADLQRDCLQRSVELCVIPALWELAVQGSRVFQIGDLLALRFRGLGLSMKQRILKRAADILFSTCAIVMLSLPVAILAAIIFLQDGRSPLYRQQRLTRDGRVFPLYKLRTMRPDAEQPSGPVLASFADPRVTRFGRFLRKTRLDELPQFVNVLKGEMSIVGPRPERPYFHDRYCARIPEYAQRLAVRAGLTGMAHVYGRYDSRPEERMKLDLYYITHYSFLLDIKIMLETVRIMLSPSYAAGLKDQDSADGQE